MKLTVNQVYGILNNQHELDALSNDAALKLFRIVVKLEDEFKAEFKAVEKARKEQDQKELNKLAQIEKEVDVPSFTQDELKDQNLLTAKVLRIFRPIISV